jgi:hypothetical protein
MLLPRPGCVYFYTQPTVHDSRMRKSFLCFIAGYTLSF